MELILNFAPPPNTPSHYFYINRGTGPHAHEEGVQPSPRCCSHSIENRMTICLFGAFIQNQSAALPQEPVFHLSGLQSQLCHGPGPGNKRRPSIRNDNLPASEAFNHKMSMRQPAKDKMFPIEHFIWTIKLLGFWKQLVLKLIKISGNRGDVTAKHINFFLKKLVRAPSFDARLSWSATSPKTSLSTRGSPDVKKQRNHGCKNITDYMIKAILNKDRWFLSFGQRAWTLLCRFQALFGGVVL